MAQDARAYALLTLFRARPPHRPVKASLERDRAHAVAEMVVRSAGERFEPDHLALFPDLDVPDDEPGSWRW